ncbi:hypothetical protein PM082_002516 [Marasmius tenuissimus]|nr:hypothetical protein PM082_002516 [Marasmius tenuissimus]
MILDSRAPGGTLQATLPTATTRPKHFTGSPNYRLSPAPIPCAAGMTMGWRLISPLYLPTCESRPTKTPYFEDPQSSKKNAHVHVRLVVLKSIEYIKAVRHTGNLTNTNLVDWSET